MKEIIGIIGAGSFGSALGHAFAAAGRRVMFWARDKSVVEEINSSQSNKKYMGPARFCGVPPLASSNLREVVATSHILVYACPSKALLDLLAELKDLPGFLEKDFVNTAKGLDLTKACLFDRRVKELLGRSYWAHHFAMLSGPGFSGEIIAGYPTCVTLAAKRKLTLARIQQQLATRYFRIYTSKDLIGVQLGGAMKNVIAIAAGIVEGLGFGLNTRTAIMNLGLGEMTRLGRKLGARAQTFRGFSGMGDLVLTCTGPESRNRRFGQYIGQGLSTKDAISKVGSTIEGISAAKAIYQMASRTSLDLAICSQVYRILHEGKNLSEGIEELLARPQLEEWR